MATTPKCNNGWQTCECTVTRCSKYDGDSLSNTGIKPGDSVTVALQKVDNALNPLTITQTILTTLENNLSLQAQFCTIINNCFTTTTTTSTSTSTTTTSSTSTTTTSTSTSTSTTTTTTTAAPVFLKLLFDFSETGSYSNSGTVIADLSGNGNNGIFSTGTGNGFPTTVTGYSTNGYLNLPGTPAQLSVRLPDSLKPTGVAPFTYIVYMQPNGYGYLPNYPGIISDDSSVGSGVTFAISPFTTPQPGSYAARNSFSDVPSLPYISGGGLGVWSVYAIKFNGTATTIYQFTSTNSGSATQVGATPIISSPSWGLFLGLRYNNWINAKFNYVAMYDGALSDLDITNIANTLCQRIIP